MVFRGCHWLVGFRCVQHAGGPRLGAATAVGASRVIRRAAPSAWEGCSRWCPWPGAPLRVPAQVDDELTDLRLSRGFGRELSGSARSERRVVAVRVTGLLWRSVTEPGGGARC